MGNQISKVMMNDRLAKAEDDVIECVSIRGTIIDLRNVSPLLRSQYRAASRRVGRHERARDELNRVAEAILAEQAIKVAPRFSGHDAMAKILGLKK